MSVDVLLLYPPFRVAVEAVLSEIRAKHGQVALTSGYRGEYEQNKLYAQGRTTPGPIVTKAKFGSSMHNFGVAGDLGMFTNGKIDWTESKYVVIGPIARKHGLVWGGDWASFKDLPHIEYDIKVLGLTLADLRKEYVLNGLPGVWKLLDVAARK